MQHKKLTDLAFVKIQKKIRKKIKRLNLTFRKYTTEFYSNTKEATKFIRFSFVAGP